MHLTPRDIEKLMLHNAGCLAQKRYARGIALNYVETVALLSACVLPRTPSLSTCALESKRDRAV